MTTALRLYMPNDAELSVSTVSLLSPYHPQGKSARSWSLSSELARVWRSLLPNTDLARAAAAVDLLAGTSSPRVGPVVTASPRLLSSLVRYGRAAASK